MIYIENQKIRIITKDQFEMKHSPLQDVSNIPLFVFVRRSSFSVHTPLSLYMGLLSLLIADCWGCIRRIVTSHIGGEYCLFCHSAADIKRQLNIFLAITNETSTNRNYIQNTDQQCINNDHEDDNKT